MRKAALLACVGTVALLHSVNVSARDIHETKTIIENIEFKRDLRSNAAEFSIPDSTVEEVQIEPGGSLSTALTSLGFGWSDIYEMLSSMKTVDNPDIIYPGHAVGKSISSDGFVNVLIERPRRKVVRISKINNNYIAELLNKSDLSKISTSDSGNSLKNNTVNNSTKDQTSYSSSVKQKSDDSGVMNRMTSLPNRSYSQPSVDVPVVDKGIQPKEKMVQNPLPEKKIQAKDDSIKISPQRSVNNTSDSSFVRYVYKEDERSENAVDDYGIIRDNEERERPRVNLAEERYKKEVERQERIKREETRLIPIPMKLPQGLEFQNSKNSFGKKDMTAKPGGRIFEQATVIPLFLEFAVLESSENAWLEMNRLRMVLPERFFEGLDLYAEPTGAGESYRIAATGNWSPEEFESYCSAFSSYGETCQVMIRRWN